MTDEQVCDQMMVVIERTALQQEWRLLDAKQAERGSEERRIALIGARLAGKAKRQARQRIAVLCGEAE